VVTTAAEKATHDVEATLRREGLEFSDIRTIEPALEDVFVSVLGAEKEGGNHG
jgi:hypothetical protein